MSDIDAALRDLVRLRAAGLCEYCRISERFTLVEHEIDHVIAVKHGGRTIAENLALTASGRVTVRLLRMNRTARIKERQLLQH